jgi:hypothetical protein
MEGQLPEDEVEQVRSLNTRVVVEVDFVLMVQLIAY